MDEFTEARLSRIAEAFVDIYIDENPLLAAKMVHEVGVEKAMYGTLKDKISGEFLKRGYSFNEE